MQGHIVNDKMERAICIRLMGPKTAVSVNEVDHGPEPWGSSRGKCGDNGAIRLSSHILVSAKRSFTAVKKHFN
jgi:hypothetical protein